MNWTDKGIIIENRKYGETSSILTMLTAEHGKHSGLIKGARNKKSRGMYEIGYLAHVEWKARLEESLGYFKCELLNAYTCAYLNDPMRLAGISSICSVLNGALPEREPSNPIYESLSSFISKLSSNDWLKNYINFELKLLSELGFSLNLLSCAVTGQVNELCYVSPKTGRAVSKNVGNPYKERLLALPPFLVEESHSSNTDILNGLNLTGYFLKRNVFAQVNRGLPAARDRLVDRVVQKNSINK